VLSAGDGRSELKLAWRPELGQYAGFLHAAMIGGMIDTACGFAAYTVCGDVLASHFSVSCLAPATGDAFVARGRVVKAGRRQVFAHAELFALDGGERASSRWAMRSWFRSAPMQERVAHRQDADHADASAR
jgi:uncharacterized protein (TIGR00369 family)